MKAYVTSVGEPSTDLTIWSLKRLGFEIVLLKDSTTLAQKLQKIYNHADDDFLRVDADITVSNEFVQHLKFADWDEDVWWIQFKTFCMYKLGIIDGGIQFIRKPALPALRANISTFLEAERPESQMYRLPEFHKPRRCRTYDKVSGLHGFGIKDFDYVIERKTVRKQDGYDWELVKKMVEFYA